MKFEDLPRESYFIILIGKRTPPIFYLSSAGVAYRNVRIAPGKMYFKVVADADLIGLDVAPMVILLEDVNMWCNGPIDAPPARKSPWP